MTGRDLGTSGNTTPATRRYGVYNIAEPEKALLDWVYLRLKGGFPVHLDELLFERLNIAELLQIGKKFPRSVLDTIVPTVLEKCVRGPAVLEKARTSA